MGGLMGVAGFGPSHSDLQLEAEQRKLAWQTLCRCGHPHPNRWIGPNRWAWAEPDQIANERCIRDGCPCLHFVPEVVEFPPSPPRRLLGLRAE
jgi:hypothetical protein